MLVIDARKAFDSGIGTYIRAVVPRLLDRLPATPVRLLVQPGARARLEPLFGRMPVAWTEVAAPPLGLAEQAALRRAIPPGALFWATSLAHPLFWRGRLLATVHDVAQLALPPAHAGGQFVRQASRIYFASLRQGAEALIFNSAFSRDEFARRVGLPRQPTAVTPLGVDPAWFGAEPRPHAQPYFVAVGNVRPHKNLATLLAAFESVAERLPHQLVIIGQHQGFRTADGAFAAHLERLGDRVRFLGQLPDAELRPWVAGAAALVMPSLYEGFGLPPLEAMAAGCLVLSSDAAALPEACGDAALFFDPRQTQPLAARLLEVAAAPAGTYDALRARARTRAQAFSWDRTADLTAAALAPLLGAAAGLHPLARDA
ncbi:MAG TPA: glycosyltransferase family 1 protein [Ramlibacter sp.]|nr:glycosyltransferase family 1 protein [Ramlibacter sp.]